MRKMTKKEGERDGAERRGNEISLNPQPCSSLLSHPSLHSLSIVQMEFLFLNLPKQLSETGLGEKPYALCVLSLLEDDLSPLSSFNHSLDMRERWTGREREIGRV